MAYKWDLAIEGGYLSFHTKYFWGKCLAQGHLEMWSEMRLNIKTQEYQKTHSSTWIPAAQTPYLQNRPYFKVHNYFHIWAHKYTPTYVFWCENMQSHMQSQWQLQIHTQAQPHAYVNLKSSTREQRHGKRAYINITCPQIMQTHAHIWALINTQTHTSTPFASFTEVRPRIISPSHSLFLSSPQIHGIWPSVGQIKNVLISHANEAEFIFHNRWPHR